MIQGLPVEARTQKHYAGVVLLVLVRDVEYSVVQEINSLAQSYQKQDLPFSIMVADVASEDATFDNAAQLQGSLDARHFVAKKFQTLTAAKEGCRTFASQLRNWDFQWFHVGTFGRELTGYEHPEDNLITVLPFYHKDVDEACNLLNWIAELGGVQDNIVLSTDSSTPDVNRVKEAAKEAFSGIEFFCYPASSEPLQWPQSNNYAWRRTAEHMKNIGRPWIWMETDGIPTDPHWHEMLSLHYQKGKMPFMGHITSNRHKNMNGLGCYPADVRAWTERAFTGPLVWDIGMTDEVRHATHQANALFNHVWMLDRDGTPAKSNGSLPRFTSHDDVDRLVGDKCLIWHRDKTQSLIPFLREKLNLN